MLQYWMAILTGAKVVFENNSIKQLPFANFIMSVSKTSRHIPERITELLQNVNFSKYRYTITKTMSQTLKYIPSKKSRHISERISWPMYR